MTLSHPRSGLPQTEAEWDAQFAAIVADLAAHADDPGEAGDTSRELSAEDRQELRGMWELGMWAERGSPPPLPSSYLITVLVVSAVCSAIVVVWMLS